MTKKILALVPVVLCGQYAMIAQGTHAGQFSPGTRTAQHGHNAFTEQGLQAELKVTTRYPVSGPGGWDYITYDGNAHRLYVSHETQVNVLDSESGKQIGVIADTPGVHGIAIAGIRIRRSAAKVDAAKLLNTPAEDTIEGLRDRAILAVGLQVGLRRAEIAGLSVEDLHQNRGFDSLRIVCKGGRRDALAIHPNVAQRIRAYLAPAGHAEDLDGPMFRPLSHNRKGQEERRYMDPDAIDRVLRKHVKAIGLGRGFSAHSMRATFITTALENGATLDDVQRAAGHAEPGTTKLYDRRGYNPEKSASFFATY